MNSWEEHKQELLKDPEFAREYEKLEPWYQEQRRLIESRIAKKNGLQLPEPKK